MVWSIKYHLFRENGIEVSYKYSVGFFCFVGLCSCFVFFFFFFKFTLLLSSDSTNMKNMNMNFLWLKVLVGYYAVYQIF